MAEVEAALLGNVPAINTGLHAAASVPSQPSSLLLRKKKDPKIAWTFKMPFSLHEELSAVAAHNGLSMTDIVIEAVQLHLPNFPHSKD
jgi:hypothetical protein